MLDQIGLGLTVDPKIAFCQETIDQATKIPALVAVTRQCSPVRRLFDHLPKGGPPPEIAALISKVQEAVTSCATAVAQKAAQAALDGDQSCVTEMRYAYRSRRDRDSFWIRRCSSLRRWDAS